MWKGRRAYLEFADTTTPDLHDMGRRPGAVPRDTSPSGEAVLSDQGPPGGAAAGAGAARVARRRAGRLASGARGRYGRAVTESLAAMGEGTLADLPDAEARADLLAWLVDRGLLDRLDDRSRAPAGSDCACGSRSGRSRPGSPSPIARPAMTEGTPRGRVRLPPWQSEDRRAGRPPPDDPGDRRPRGKQPAPPAGAAGGWNSPGGSPIRPTRSRRG